MLFFEFSRNMSIQRINVNEGYFEPLNRIRPLDYALGDTMHYYIEFSYCYFDRVQLLEKSYSALLFLSLVEEYKTKNV